MKKGFTLMEMILVLLIIAMLVLLTVPKIQKVFEIVTDKGCDAQLKIVDSAILQYMLVNESAPTSIADLEQENLLTSSQARCQNGRLIRITNGEATLE